MNKLKKIIRELIRPIYRIKYFIFKNNLNRASDGAPLKKGISAVISMKDEEYTIEASIRSLHGFADQIICIDNGSTDRTVKIVQTSDHRNYPMSSWLKCPEHCSEIAGTKV